VADLDPEEFRRLGRQAVDWVAGYRAGLAGLPVRPPVAPGEVRTELDKPLSELPRGFDELLAELDRVLVPGNTNWQHPRMFGFFPANASLHSLLGDVLSGGLGSQGMLWSTSPALTELEQVLLDRLADELGLGPAFTFPGGGGGVIQDSASSASLVALLASLHRANPQWREDGVSGRERVYVTAETHSSLAKAVRVAGLGGKALRVVDTDPATLGMSGDALARVLAEDVAAGLVPAMVCATIGTTGTGAVDPVPAVADAIAAAAPGTWLHVDAAWAGVAALCPEHRGLLDGVDRADSFCTDAHKWLLTAFDASLFWVRDGTALPAALSITPEYLRDTASESARVVDYRDWQVPLGRRFRALKLWAVLSGVGLAGLREYLRGHIALAAELAGRIRADPGFELAIEPSLALLCLRVVTGRGPAADDEATRRVLERINASGRALITHTAVAGRYVLRVAVGSVTTAAEHVDELWEMLQAEAAVERG
jgi:aromatic-L-amino-acid decarboxylase